MTGGIPLVPRWLDQVPFNHNYTAGLIGFDFGRTT